MKSTTAILVLALTLTLCAQAQSYTIGLIPKRTGNEYWDTIHAGAIKAQRELKDQGTDIKILYEGIPTETDHDGQIALINSMVARKVHGIVIAPLHVRTIAPSIEAASAAKIPCVTIDSGLKSAAPVSFVATENYNGGALGARRLGTLLDNKGKVILLRCQKGASSTEAREEGFLATLKTKYPGIEILSATEYAGGSESSAHEAAVALLKKHGTEVNGIFCPNEYTTAAMLVALREAGLAGGKVKFVGFDSSTRTLEALRAGDIQGLVVQNPFQMGYLGVKTLVAHLKGQTVERDVDTGCVTVTPENITNPMVADLLNPPLDKYLKP